MLTSMCLSVNLFIHSKYLSVPLFPPPCPRPPAPFSSPSPRPPALSSSPSLRPPAPSSSHSPKPPAPSSSPSPRPPAPSSSPSPRPPAPSSSPSPGLVGQQTSIKMAVVNRETGQDFHTCHEYKVTWQLDMSSRWRWMKRHNYHVYRTYQCTRDIGLTQSALSYR